MIESAIQILRVEGFEGLSLRQCAKKANVSASAPAHHFKNLNKLLTAVAAYGFGSLGDNITKSLAGSRKTMQHDRIKTISLAYLKFAIDNPDLYRVMFTPTLDRDDPDFVESHRRCFSILKDELAQNEPKVLSEEVDFKAFRAWALAHGFVVLLLGDRLQMAFPDKRLQQTGRELSEAFLRCLF